jgi:virginiamycin B lyase
MILFASGEKSLREKSRGNAMHRTRLWLLSSTALFLFAATQSAFAASAVALSGQVSSAKEGAMEGVLVTAKREGSNISVTVVSDDKGRYQFPAGRLEPGKYNLKIRAIGYVLDGPRDISVTAGGAAADLKLAPTTNIVPQLTNSDWLMSIPGTE